MKEEIYKAIGVYVTEGTGRVSIINPDKFRLAKEVIMSCSDEKPIDLIVSNKTIAILELTIQKLKEIEELKKSL